MKTLSQNVEAIEAEIQRSARIAQQLGDLCKSLTGYDRPAGNSMGGGGGGSGITGGAGGGMVHEVGKLESLESSITDLEHINDTLEITIKTLTEILK